LQACLQLENCCINLKNSNRKKLNFKKSFFCRQLYSRLFLWEKSLKARRKSCFLVGLCKAGKGE
jgi:hypothetical protein